MDPIKLKRYRDSFQYFLYDLRSKKKQSDYTGSIIQTNIFFSEEKFAQYLRFSHLITGEDKLIFVDKQEIKVGFTVFLCFFAYYHCLYKTADIFFISHARLFKYYSNIIKEISLMFETIISSPVEINNNTKEVSFSKSGSSIKFLSDNTYEFRGYNNKTDFIFFDSAGLNNYDKLVFFLESVLQGLYTEKVIMNFNCLAKEKSKLITDFENKMKIINIK